MTRWAGNPRMAVGRKAGWGGEPRLSRPCVRGRGLAAPRALVPPPPPARRAAGRSGHKPRPLSPGLGVRTGVEGRHGGTGSPRAAAPAAAKHSLHTDVVCVAAQPPSRAHGALQRPVHRPAAFGIVGAGKGRDACVVVRGHLRGRDVAAWPQATPGRAGLAAPRGQDESWARASGFCAARAAPPRAAKRSTKGGCRPGPSAAVGSGDTSAVGAGIRQAAGDGERPVCGVL